MLLLLFAGASTGAAPSAKKHVGWMPEWEQLRHDPAELERRIEQQRRESFGPKRYEEIKALEAAAKEATRKAAELKREQDRLAALAAIEEARSLAREARESAYYDAERHIQLLQLRNALEGFSSAHSAVAKMKAAHVLELAAISARHRFDDDEEAIALLLLH